MSDLHEKPAREVDLDKPGSEVGKLYIKLPATRIVKTAQDAIMAEDANRPVQKWYPESFIAKYVQAEEITR